MKSLFYEGGAFFMGVLTLLLVGIVVWIVFHLIKGITSNTQDKGKVLRNLKYGRSIGLFLLFFGGFVQLLGIYQAFSVIEKAADISPALIFSGMKISMITTLYGIIIYLIALFLWFLASLIVERR